MIPQITRRQIGGVTIIDIKGPLTGVWALREKAVAMRKLVAEEEQAVILNLKGMTQLDTVGAKAIFETLAKGRQVGIFGGSPDVLDVLGRFSQLKRFRMFRDEAEVVSVFGADFVRSLKDREKRKHGRLRTALPLEFSCRSEREKIYFHAIVTNLSETGLFAEYIDLEAAEQSLEQLSPYDLKVIELKLLLPKGKSVEAEGKVAHRKLDGDQVGIGIEFTRMEPEGRA